MRFGFFCFALAAGLALSFLTNTAPAQQPVPGIQPSPPVQQPQQPQQAPVQGQAQQQYPVNNGNYVGAPLAQFHPTFLQGQWVTSCLGSNPLEWPAPGVIQAIPNTYRQQSFTFSSDGVTFTVQDFRDFNCQAPLGAPAHTEMGTWYTSLYEPAFPTYAEIQLIMNTCSGLGCHPYNPDREPYSSGRVMITLLGNRLHFAHRLEGGMGVLIDKVPPLYPKGYEPTALPPTN